MSTASQLKQLARRKQVRLFRAFLAEDYDGIGQYVTLALSKASISAGLKAKISPGDFNTGTEFPAGTEVTAFSYHGQVEILSLGVKPVLAIPTVPVEPPIIPVIPDCADVLFDLFERSVAPGWGTNDFGLDYSYKSLDGTAVEGSGNYASVADFGEGSVGKIRWETGSPEIYLGPNGATNGTDVGPWQEDLWTLRRRMKTGDWTYGGNDGYALIALRTNARDVTLKIGSNFGFSFPNGSIQTDDSIEYDFDWHPNQWYEIRWRYNFLTGDSWLKIWHEDDSEPDWLITESSYDGLGGDDPSRWMNIDCVSLGSLWDSANPYIAYFDDSYFCYI